MTGQKHLLIVDYFSKYLYVPRMTSTNSEATINKFKEIFSIEGALIHLITDNGPPFNSAELAYSAYSGIFWNFKHMTSSPNYPQSDGQTECAVQTVRQRMLRCKQDGQDWRQTLLELRTRPTKDLPSPAGSLAW